MKLKVNANLIFPFSSKLLILIIDHAENCLTHFFITATYQRFSTGPVHKQENSLLAPKVVFPQNIGSNNPIRVDKHTKKQLKVV